MASKKISIIGGSFVLVAAVVACVVVLVANNKSSNNHHAPGAPAQSGAIDASTSIMAISSICQPVSYKDTCEEVLSKTVGNQSDIKSIVQTSIQATIDNFEDALNHTAVIEEATNDPETLIPVQTCMEIFDYAMDDLEDAISHLVNYELGDLKKSVLDLKNWLSSARTYEEICLDEFNNKTSDVAESMKKVLNQTIQLTDNALDIVDQASKIVSDFKLPSLLGGAMSGNANRRLRSADDEEEGLPSWLSEERRKLLQLPAPLFLPPTVVVAQDGSGQFRTINEGLAALPRENQNFVVLYIKAGVYREQVIVEKDLNMLIMVGDGPDKTRISANFNVGNGKTGVGTYDSATVGVIASDFMARDIGFENYAGPEGHQAVAFRCNGDQAVLLNCHFDGFQDTLYASQMRQFYRDCTITGTVDFIFGNAQAIFQNCNIIARLPMANQQNMMTAHGSTKETENTVFVLHNCTLTAEPALVPFIERNPTYLGRPWKQFARTVYMQSYIDSLIHPDGWMPWQESPDFSNTCMYAEIENRGPGADKSRRVNWPGIKNLDLRAGEAYTLDSLYQGADFVKRSGTPIFEGTLQPATLSNQLPFVPPVTPLPVDTKMSAPPKPRPKGIAGKARGKGKRKGRGKRGKGTKAKKSD